MAEILGRARPAEKVDLIPTAIRLSGSARDMLRSFLNAPTPLA